MSWQTGKWYREGQQGETLASAAIGFGREETERRENREMEKKLFVFFKCQLHLECSAGKKRPRSLYWKKKKIVEICYFAGLFFKTLLDIFRKRKFKIYTQICVSSYHQEKSMLSMLASKNQQKSFAFWLEFCDPDLFQSAVNFLLCPLWRKGCLCCLWSRAQWEGGLENKCCCFPGEILERTPDTITASRVVHPPAWCLLPRRYQLDMFHHTACGGISHAWMKKVAFKKRKKNTQPSAGGSQLPSGLHSYSCYTAPGSRNHGQ